MGQLTDLDTEIFLLLNGMHAPWLDQTMVAMTKNFLWVPLYAILVYTIIKHYRQISFFVFIALAIAITLSDRFTSGLMKPYFKRLRPSHEPELEGLVHTVDGYVGGMYGFASSHAANTFAVATFFFVLFRNKNPWIGLLFIWAALVTYTRIYLGVHYPADVIVGGLIGAAFGYLMSRIFISVYQKYIIRRGAALE